MSQFPINENKVYDCNIVSFSNYQETVKRTLRILAKTLAKTLGPYGNNIAIENIPESYFTKDGHTILSNIRFSGNIENMVLSMIKKISSRMNRSVGDGTTSSIVVAYYLYNELSKLLDNDTRVNGRVLNNILLFLVEKISSRIEELSFKPSNNSWIKEVAKISANNNEEIGKLVAGAYKHYEEGILNIIVEQSSNEFYHSKLSSGYKLNYGLNSTLYINNSDKKVYNQSGDVNIFLSEVPLTSESLKILNAVVQQAKAQNYRTLVIIAPGYDNFVKSFFEVNKQRDPMLNYVCVETPSPTTNTKAEAEYHDMALILGCIPYNGHQTNFSYHEEFISKIGTQKITVSKAQTEYVVLGLIKGSVEISEYYTQFIGENPYQKEVIAEEIIRLQKAYEGMTKSFSDDPNFDNSARDLKNRINKFSGNSTLTLYIGGSTDVERKTMTYLVQDAVYAVASALKYGLVPGQCASIIFALTELEKRTSDEIEGKIIKALKCAYIEYQLLIQKNYFGNIEEIKKHIESLEKEIEKNYQNEDNNLEDKKIFLSTLERKLHEFMNPNEVNNCDLGNNIVYITEFMGKEENPLPISMPYEYFKNALIPPAPNSAETDINIFTSVVSIVNLLVNSRAFLGRNALSSTSDF